MKELLGLPLFSVLLTLGAYQLGLWFQHKVRSSLANPLLISILLVLAALWLTGLPNTAYQAGSSAFSWLLTPATVCLAIPLHSQLRLQRRSLPAICAGVAAGTAACLATVLAGGALFGLEPVLTISLLPKSITTAMGIALTELSGGIPAITTTAIIATGILGSLLGPWFARLFRIIDPIAQGVAFGTASHVIGTAKASEQSELTGAVSSLSLVIAGILTAILFPCFVSLLTQQT